MRDCLAHIVAAYIVMAFISMAYIAMTFTCMAINSYGPDERDLCATVWGAPKGEVLAPLCAAPPEEDPCPLPTYG